MMASDRRFISAPPGIVVEGIPSFQRYAPGAKRSALHSISQLTAVTWVDEQVGDFIGDGKANFTGRVLQSGQWWTALSNGSTSFQTSLSDSWSAAANWVDVHASAKL